MFHSGRRELNYPQFEHARLAALLAEQWGNAEFSFPPIDREVLTRGVLMHDRGYGWLDNVPLLNQSDEQRQAIMRVGLLEQDPEGPLVDRIVKLHICRLMEGSKSTSLILLRERAQAEFEREIQDWPLWRQVDSVTDLCDRLSFEFCFEVPRRRTVRLPLGQREVEFSYGLSQPGRLVCQPWPFWCQRLEGRILGYDRQGYPSCLVPRWVPYEVVPG